MQRLTTIAVGLIATVLAFGQNAQTPAPAFDVASIKPAAPGQRGRFIRSMPGGHVNVTNMPLKDLIQMAYKIQPFQITGGPPGLDSDAWDINAKPDSDPGPNQMPLMLQGLLADRFGLKFHRETRDMQIYVLVAANEKGKPTPGLALAKEGGCTVPDPSKPPPPPEPGKGPTLFCGGMFMGLNQMHAQAVPLANLIPMLSRTLGRTVIDKTGITAKYDINLEWTPDPGQNEPDAIAPPGVPPPTFDPNGPSIYTALQEQLGLKLESQKGAVEVFVIDHAEKPAEN